MPTLCQQPGILGVDLLPEAGHTVQAQQLISLRPLTNCSQPLMWQNTDFAVSTTRAGWGQVSRQGTVTLWGSGTHSHDRYDARSLLQLPGWAPQQPRAASLATSALVVPSWTAAWAISWTAVALISPELQSKYSFVAKGLCQLWGLASSSSIVVAAASCAATLCSLCLFL